jgi:hypothetical protein
MSVIASTGSGSIQRLLATLRLGERQFHKELTLWPLVRHGEQTAQPGARYIPLAEALERNAVEVDEVSEGGSIPHIRVGNRGDEAVLVLFGEELVGAKQNRVANATFLVPPRSQLVIDVSCVEQGRWSRARGQRFEGIDSTLSQSLRRKMARSVSEARSAGRGFAADQGEVWEEVAGRVQGSGARSPTFAYQDYVETRSVDREQIVRAFQPLPGQVGFIAALGEEVVGLEAVGDAEVFRQVFHSLLRSYAIDAVDRVWLRSRESERAKVAAFDSPESFLEALGTADLERSPSLGLGEDLRIEGKDVAGCALEVGEIVHLTGFAQ